VAPEGGHTVAKKVKLYPSLWGKGETQPPYPECNAKVCRESAETLGEERSRRRERWLLDQPKKNFFIESKTPPSNNEALEEDRREGGKKEERSKSRKGRI